VWGGFWGSICNRGVSEEDHPRGFKSDQLVTARTALVGFGMPILATRVVLADVPEPLRMPGGSVHQEGSV
jgi:hypothetical protein